eukprot:CAMPEP_0173435166 /NCGR_PEP_ID=MMETSP1357-20121228/14368_1 /TAXON_ID=77926 /ORGANISM="Hemiselmis rufescens, Strain PCC563" /LENGTH=404 /DNA_ID=CAMNT_0014400119 /DNA_START=8 /DNA_END=1222 /DNA_ORIENTATION=-
MAARGLFKGLLGAGGIVVAGVAWLPHPIAGDMKEHYGTLLYKKVAWPVLRRIDPETTHNISVQACAMGLTPVDRVKDSKTLSTQVMGLDMSNPLGLAAGWDKQAEAVVGALNMGFGHVEIGSVTPLPQPGNPKPRMFRLEQDQAVINRYGFNSEGAEAVYLRLRELRKNPVRGVVGINLGKNKEGDAVKDFTYGVERFGDVADYLVVNVSSPNTPGLRTLQKRSELEKLLKAVVSSRNKHCPTKPVLVKIAPDNSDQDLVDICVVAKKVGVQGMIVSNTTNDRPDSLINAEGNKQETGGLSGAPLKDKSTECLKKVYVLTEGKIPLIGVGGVGSGADAYEKIRAGASMVQMYTRLAYEGPYAVRKIKRDLDNLIKKDGFSGVSECVGLDARAKYPAPAKTGLFW